MFNISVPFGYFGEEFVLQDGREVEPRNQVAEVCEVQEFWYWGVEDGEVVQENGCEMEEWVYADSKEDILSNAGGMGLEGRLLRE